MQLVAPIWNAPALTTLRDRARELEDQLRDTNESDHNKKRQCDRVWKAEGQYLRFLRTNEGVQNFTTMKIIGKGAFGEVKLVQRKRDGKIYALKSLVKTEMFKKDQLAHVRAERDILAESDSPWVVKLQTTFQDKSFLYMLMEFLPGGDLMTMLIKYEIFSEDITRFYMAEIVLAIEAVHALGYVHRYVVFYYCQVSLITFVCLVGAAMSYLVTLLYCEPSCKRSKLDTVASITCQFLLRLFFYASFHIMLYFALLVQDQDV